MNKHQSYQKFRDTKLKTDDKKMSENSKHPQISISNNKNATFKENFVEIQVIDLDYTSAAVSFMKRKRKQETH